MDKNQSGLLNMYRILQITSDEDLCSVPALQEKAVKPCNGPLGKTALQGHFSLRDG